MRRVSVIRRLCQAGELRSRHANRVEHGLLMRGIGGDNRRANLDRLRPRSLHAGNGFLHAPDTRLAMHSFDGNLHTY
jgi:hypothetical protein